MDSFLTVVPHHFSEAFLSQVIETLIKGSQSQSVVVNCLTILGAPFEFIPVKWVLCSPSHRSHLNFCISPLCSSFEGSNEQKSLSSELSLRIVNCRIDKYSTLFQPVIPKLHDLLKNPPIVSRHFGFFSFESSLEFFVFWVLFFACLCLCGHCP